MLTAVLGDVRNIPVRAIVCGDLNLGNPAETRPGVPGDRHRPRLQLRSDRWCPDRRGNGHFSHRPLYRSGGVDDDIVLDVEITLKRVIENGQANQPFRRGNASPTRNEQPYGSAMGAGRSSPFI